MPSPIFNNIVSVSRASSPISRTGFCDAHSADVNLRINICIDDILLGNKFVIGYIDDLHFTGKSKICSKTNT